MNIPGSEQPGEPVQGHRLTELDISQSQVSSELLGTRHSPTSANDEDVQVNVAVEASHGSQNCGEVLTNSKIAGVE
jgi:hypothetical protein